MKVHPYSKAVSWITRPRVMETATLETYTPELERMNFRPGSEQQVAGLSDVFPGTFTSYNDAVHGGFQGTMEEWLQQQSIPQTERPLAGGGRVSLKPGGLVEPGVTHYATTQFSIAQRKKTLDKIGDAIWKASETGDMEYLMSSPERQKEAYKRGRKKTKTITYKKGMISESMANVFGPLAQNEDGLRHIAKTYNMDVEHILDILDEKKEFEAQSRHSTKIKKQEAHGSKLRSDFAKGEKWMLKNAHRFNDPAKFKAAYIKRFGRGDAFIKAINKGNKSYFSVAFDSDILGRTAKVGQTSPLTKSLGDNIFSSVFIIKTPKLEIK